MHIMNVMVVRRGKVRLVEAVQRASDPKAALALVKDRVEPELQEPALLDRVGTEIVELR